MWVDAMSLDQKNILGRNEQVTHMKQIYKLAEMSLSDSVMTTRRLILEYDY